MNSKRTTLYKVLACLAILVLLPSGIGRAQAATPPPPAVPFDAVPTEAGAPSMPGPSIPVAIGEDFQMGGDRLASLQNPDGGWGWPVTGGSALNTIAPISMGLGVAFEHTADGDMRTALQNAGALLLTKVNNFSPSDGYMAAQLDVYFGGTTYTDYIKANFYDKLAAGTYDRWDTDLGIWDPGNPLTTVAYVNVIRNRRANQGIPNLAAWDVGMGLVAASMVGADTAPWIAGTEAEVNELDGTKDYDVIGLAGALYGLAMVGDNSFDPTSGQHALADSLDGLFTILLGYQLGTGGWTWNSAHMTENSDETIQETAYSLLALNEHNRGTYLPAIIKGADYLDSVQLGSGGWQDFTGDGENNEVTGEALWGLNAGYRLGDVWVCVTGDCGHPEASYNTIQEGVDNVLIDGTVHVLAGTYNQRATITRTLHMFGAGIGSSIIQAPATLPNTSAGSDSSILLIKGSDVSVEISGFTITGPGPSGCGSIIAGIFVRDEAFANIHNNSILDIRDNPISGCQNGAGIFVGRNAYSTAGSATISDNLISGYQKGGIVIDNAGSDATITNNTVTGMGTTDVIAQNGIQVSRGATATLSGNTVTGNSYHNDLNPSNWGSAGLLLYQAGTVTFGAGNSVSLNDQNLYTDGSASFSVGNTVFGGSSAPAGIGADIYNDGTAAIDATGASFTGALNGFDIEDRVYHELDDSSKGLVTWTANNVYVTQNSGSIQRGIDAASDGWTVNVDNGSFAERIVIDKPLSLMGQGASFGPAFALPTPPVPVHTTIDATSFLTAGHVIDITTLTGMTHIEGFDILTGDNSNGIHFTGGTDADGAIQIVSNHIIATNSHDDQYGIIGGYGDVRTVTITGNEISNTYSNSILAELQMGPTTISGNTFNGAFPSVFYMTYDGEDVSTAQKISGNTFDFSTADAGTNAAGVGVNPSTYYVDASRRTGKYADFEISGNTFSGIGDVSLKAISVGENSLDGTSGGFDSLKIFGNTISGTDGKGIQLFGHITDADIHDNIITGLFQGIKAFTYESTFYPENNNIYHNQITGASDMLVYWTGSPAVFNVTENWWGDILGPNPAKMSADVDYKPWCGDAACTFLLPPYPVTTVITDTPDPSWRGDSVTFSISMTNDISGGPVPAGTITVSDGSLSQTQDPIPACEDMALDGSGQASCSVTFTTGGAHPLSVVFTPDNPDDFDGYTKVNTHKVWMPLSDFNGDGTSEVAVYRPSDSSWHVKGGATTVFGVVGDLAVPGDYNGDGTTEFAVYHPATGQWSVDGGPTVTWGGAAGDIPVPGDYNGDGKTDFAVYRPSNGVWYIKGLFNSAWGFVAGDEPVPGDYNGDGKTDVAIFRPSNGVWYIKNLFNSQWGTTLGDLPVPGDYDGNGSTDVAVFRPSNSIWYVKNQFNKLWGASTDIPVPADYNGDRITELAAFRPSTQMWYLKGLTNSVFGNPGDYPLPAPDTNGDGDPYQ